MKGTNTLKAHLYQIGKFAKIASVTVRTLRFYDKSGLLIPSGFTESGYRLYTDDDLVRLQRILSLKFLGLSLNEIKVCLKSGPVLLKDVLAEQRELMQAKRRQIDDIVNAIDETESLLLEGRCDWESISRVIQCIQMEQKSDWVKKYFTDEQLQTMNKLRESSYSDEANEHLLQRSEWTEADQEQANQQWQYVASESDRLASINADPGGEEAQALAKFKCDLLSAFTQGNSAVEEGLNNFWEGFNALPDSEKPFDASPFMPNNKGEILLNEAMAIYRQRSTG